MREGALGWVTLVVLAVSSSAYSDPAQKLPDDSIYNNRAYRIVSGFHANTNSDGSYRPIPHQGIDIRMPVGTPVRAAESGEIISVGPAKYGGRQVYIGTDKQFSKVSLEYNHLRRVTVKKKDYVEIGDIIGYSGQDSSGRTEIHFAVWRGGQIKNPMSFFVGYQTGQIECAQDIDPNANRIERIIEGKSSLGYPACRDAE